MINIHVCLSRVPVPLLHDMATKYGKEFHKAAFAVTSPSGQIPTYLILTLVEEM